MILDDKAFDVFICYNTGDKDDSAFALNILLPVVESEWGNHCFLAERNSQIGSGKYLRVKYDGWLI